MRNSLLPALLATFIVFMAPARPVHANAFTRVLTAVPRAAGRTLKNMVTCERKVACVEQWANVAAVIADGVTTRQFVVRCPTRCIEQNAWLYGLHPTTRRLSLTMPLVALGEVTITQYSHELVTGGRKGGVGLASLPALYFTSGHAQAAWNNSKLPYEVIKGGK